MTEIPAEAALAAADAIQQVVCGTVARDVPDEREYCEDAARAALAAALPHLRVQETGQVGGYATTGGGTFSASATPHPRPVVDREAINHALNLHWWDEDDQPCVCGFDFLAAGQSFKMHLADVMAALLPTEEGEGS